MESEMEINKTLHEFMGFQTWSDPTACVECGRSIEEHYQTGDEFIAPPEMPVYDQSLDAIAEVEAKVIERFGADAYLRAMYQEIDQSEKYVDGWTTADAMTAPATVRAKACLAVIESK